MAFDFKDKDRLVEDVLRSIQSKIPVKIDTSVGEPLRTIVEAIMQELHLQYWQLEQVYNSSFIDTAYGDDLSELVKILGIERRGSIKARGEVTFLRETPAQYDYYIPSGTLVQTLPNQEGEVFQYETIIDSMLNAGETEVTIPVRAVQGGSKSNVVEGKVVIINDPPFGIESVINRESISGGEDEETDEELRDRAKRLLDTIGLGTVNALRNKISEIYGVKRVNVIDMARGIGTADILVLGDTLPLSSTIKEEIDKVIFDTKAAGIDVQYLEPNLLSLDIEAKLIMEAGYLIEDVELDVNKAIHEYIDNLDIGEMLILNQLERHILNSNNNIKDVIMINPIANTQPDSIEIIRVNTITLSEG